MKPDPTPSEASDSPPALAFGRYTVIPSRQVVLANGLPLQLGSRALALLCLLVQRAGQVVDKETLTSHAWPKMVVAEINLRVQINALRRALGDGLNGVTYIANVPGRGYCFVAPVATVADDSSPSLALSGESADVQPRLPRSVNRMIGREAAAQAVCMHLGERRFVTLLGPGGIGKTTLALSVAREAAGAYEDGVCFVSLEDVKDQSSLAGAMASVFSLPPSSAMTSDTWSRVIGERRMLVVLDNCEHVARGAAELIESLLTGAPNVDVLATSREPLRGQGEWLHRLPPLTVPPAEVASTKDALQYTAVQLFAERAAASLEGWRLRDEDVADVANICRQLDGLPLAIDLCVSRVHLFGVSGLSNWIDDHVHLLAAERRTSSTRHRSLRSVYDWSYEALPPIERAVLRRLARLQGRFSEHQAVAACSDATLSPCKTRDSLLSLVSKSLVEVDATHPTAHYKLMELTRAYAGAQFTDDADWSRPAS